jgi:hypothetical protein
MTRSRTKRIFFCSFYVNWSSLRLQLFKPVPDWTQKIEFRLNLHKNSEFFKNKLWSSESRERYWRQAPAIRPLWLSILLEADELASYEIVYSDKYSKHFEMKPAPDLTMLSPHPSAGRIQLHDSNVKLIVRFPYYWIKWN